MLISRWFHISFIINYCWWKKSCTTWHDWKLVVFLDIQHINWCRTFTTFWIQKNTGSGNNQPQNWLAGFLPTKRLQKSIHYYITYVCLTAFQLESTIWVAFGWKNLLRLTCSFTYFRLRYGSPSNLEQMHWTSSLNICKRVIQWVPANHSMVTSLIEATMIIFSYRIALGLFNKTSRKWA